MENYNIIHKKLIIIFFTKVENQQSKVEKEVGNIIQSNNMISHENVEGYFIASSIILSTIDLNNQVFCLI